VILDPINDGDCLGQLTAFARELVPSKLVHSVAAHLGKRDTVIEWLQSLPQADDLGDERVRVIQCDVPQRARLFPDDPNCVERSLGAMILLEVIDPKTPRALATVDKPLRHTGLVEQYGGHWHAVDLFPRRNARRDFSWGSFGKDVMYGATDYVIKPVAKVYLGDKVGGATGDYLHKGEDWLVKGGGKNQPNQQKKDTPPPDGAERANEEPQLAIAPRAQQPTSGFSFTSLFGSGANQNQGAGGEHAAKEEGPRGAGALADRTGRTARGDRQEGEAEEGGDRDSHDARDVAQRFWQSLRW
jgi:hypothetical protein